MKRFSSNTPLACSKIFNQVGRVKAGNANCNNNSILISSCNHFISNNYNTDLLSSQETATATKPMIKARIKFLHKDYRRFSTSIQDPTYHPIHSKKTNEKVNGDHLYSSSVITPVPNSNTDTAPANKLLARGYCIGKGDADYEDADDKLYGGEDAYFIQDNTILLGDLTNSLYSKHLSSSNPLKKSNNDPSAPTINDSNTNNIKPIQCIGVADGVGGWRNILGIDASLMARQMMQNCFFYSFHSELIKHPLQLMQLAYNEIIEKKQVTAGSTTCCLLMISEENPNILLSANLGDSGFLVLRNKNGDNNYQIVYRSIPQQHYHNAPYQLAVVPHYLTNKFQDEPTDAMCDAIPIENDDIIILASDGLFDNLYDQQIVDLVNQNINQMDEYQLSKLIAVKARRVGFGTDFVTSTPFQDASEKEGIFYLGGKPDDITVVVSRVVR
ncbi:hypothetical protein ABK040_010883 [Willaertia magna]